jgi:hypothetical protein
MAPAAAASEPGRASVWIGDTILALGLVTVLIAAYLAQS